ncbi:MAG TPA: c-type cytochrome [Bacilli bacterium]
MHSHHGNEKVVYVGDSRIVKNRMPNIPPDYTEYPGKTEPLVPNFLLKEWMIGATVMIGFMVLIMTEPAPLGYPADPTNTAFIPMPDWYFLFLYQLLKYPYMSEHFKIFGTLIVPAVAFGALFLAPFLDRGPHRQWFKRPLASTFMLVSIAAVVYLTQAAWAHYQEELKANGQIPEHIQREIDLKAGKPMPKPGQKVELPAIVDPNNKAADIYKKATCVSCHGTDLKGSPPAVPALLGVGDSLSKDEIIKIMKDGRGQMPPGMWDASKAQGGLTDDDMNALADWLSKQKKAE